MHGLKIPLFFFPLTIGTCVTRESLEKVQTDQSMKQEGGLKLSAAWLPLHEDLKDQDLKEKQHLSTCQANPVYEKEPEVKEYI